MFASHLTSPADQQPRDLACADLWERSLERSRRRRELADLHRKHAPRRKGVSLAMSAALLASPMVPMASAATSGSGGTAAEETGPADADNVLAGAAILRVGDSGAAVAAVQKRLAVDDDGIYGPITVAAVKDFQDRVGLPVSGEVDARTWTELFRADVTSVPEGSAVAAAIRASTRAEPAADDGDRAPAARAASMEQASGPSDDESASHSSSQRTASSDEDDASDGNDSDRRSASEVVSGGSSDDESGLGAREGGARPEAGVDRESDIDEGDGEAPAGEVVDGGDCATGKLASPLEDYAQTSTFGDGRNHAGWDMAAPMGTAIRAALCGTVTQASSTQGGYGKLVCIRSTASFSTCHAHMSEIGTKEGAYVEVGQVIGRVGSTGRSTGPHLHFETRVDGQAQDPSQYLGGERKVAGTGTGGGGEVRAASNAGGDEQRASASSLSSTDSGSGSARSASTREAQHTGAGGGTPPRGVASNQNHDPRDYQ